MADHSEVAYTTADGNDYPEHEQTYLTVPRPDEMGHSSVVVVDPDSDGLFPGPLTIDGRGAK